MTREDFEKHGFKVVTCRGNSRCSPLPHIHATLFEDVEYCPVGSCIFVNTVGFVGVPASRMPLEVARECSVEVFRVAGLVKPDWTLEAIHFV